MIVERVIAAEVEQAACGHFAAWSQDGALLHRVCSCPSFGRVASVAVVAPRDERIPCPNPGCNGFLPRPGAAHAPHWVTRDGRQVLVDCSGKEIAS